jgi:glycosyl transferase family 87
MRLRVPLQVPRARSELIRALLLVPGLALALWVSLHYALRDLKGYSGGPQSDFAQAIYYPVRALLDGLNPYDASSFRGHYPVGNAFAPYFPSTLLLHLPFGFMPLVTAAACYLVVGILLTVVLAVLCLRLNGLKSSIPKVLFLVIVIVLSRPWRQCMLLGQVTMELVLASYVTLYFARSAPRLSGLGLAFTSFKPSYGFPLALLMLVRRDRLALLYATLFVLLLNLPVGAILAYRAGGIHMFAKQLGTTFGGFQAMAPANSPVFSQTRIDAVALVGRIVGQAPGVAGQMLVAISVLGLAAIAIRTGSKSPYDKQSFGWSSGLVCAAVLLSGYHQPHDLLLLTLPFVAAADRRLCPAIVTARLRLTMLVLVTFLTFNYLVSDFVFHRLNLMVPGAGGDLETLAREPPAVALASLNGLALLVLFCSYVAIALNQPQPELPGPSVAVSSSNRPPVL